MANKYYVLAYMPYEKEKAKCVNYVGVFDFDIALKHFVNFSQKYNSVCLLVEKYSSYELLQIFTKYPKPPIIKSIAKDIKSAQIFMGV